MCSSRAPRARGGQDQEARQYSVAGADLIRGGGWGTLGGYLLLSFEEQKTYLLNNLEYRGRNKGKHSGQVLHRNFYFVALLVFLMQQFSIRF